MQTDGRLVLSSTKVRGRERERGEGRREGVRETERERGREGGLGTNQFT